MKKGLYSKLLIVFIVAANALFAMAVLYVFSRSGQEPTGLITAWFAFTTGELWQLAKIKRKKIESEEKDNEGDS